MTIKTAKKFTATLTIGLQKGYGAELFTKSEIINVLQKIQDALIEESKVYLSASVSDCDIVLSGQVEPSVRLDFINYPKFPLEENKFKRHLLELAESLMKRLQQNRTVVVFHDEIVMLEETDAIDPRIKKNS